MQDTPVVASGFDGLGLAPSLVERLNQLKFTSPTPIQLKAIPIAVEGKDVVGIAQTGTGKTFAFGLPMLQRIAKEKGQGLVILPTRELALQVEESLMLISRSVGLRCAVLIGGASMRPQIDALRRKPHVIIATPGRLIDHVEQRTVDLKNVKILVLDEADRMFDMGFAPQLNKILAMVPRERQTMLFSATMPDQIMSIAKKHMQLPVRVEVAPAGTAAERVVQELFIVDRSKKLALLVKLLEEYKGTVLVFSRTKHGAKRITSSLRLMKYTANEIHANRSLYQRKEALEGFKTGRYRVLVATDIAARGIDVKGIELVINFDLPDNSEDYIHRIGRTGRAGQEGRAISFATPDQGPDVRSIERLMRKPLAKSPMPELPVLSAGVESAHRERFEDSRSGGRSSGGSRGGYGGGQGGSRGYGTSRSYGQGASQAAGGASSRGDYRSDRQARNQDSNERSAQPPSRGSHKAGGGRSGGHSSGSFGKKRRDPAFHPEKLKRVPNQYLAS